MKVLDMLMGISTAAEKEKYRVGEKCTPEAIAKRTKTMRENRNQRWKEAFMKCDNRANYLQVAEALNLPSTTVSSMLRKMRNETPPVVKVVDTETVMGPGNNPIERNVFKWIGV